jgi:hypothetical protein
VPLSGKLCPSFDAFQATDKLQIAVCVYVRCDVKVDRSLLAIPVAISLDVNHVQVILFKISQRLLEAPTRLIVTSADRSERLIRLCNHFPDLKVIVGDHWLDNLVVDYEYVGIIAIALVEIKAHANESNVLLALKRVKDVLEGNIHSVFL